MYELNLLKTAYAMQLLLPSGEDWAPKDLLIDKQQPKKTFKNLQNRVYVEHFIWVFFALVRSWLLVRFAKSVALVFLCFSICAKYFFLHIRYIFKMKI
jgi:Ca2+-dependent lipid-binding protein